jgi:hypothetical protein
MSQPLHTTWAEQDILEARKRLEDQRALVKRMIIQGAPTQAAVDQLRELQRSLLRMTEQHRPTRS